MSKSLTDVGFKHMGNWTNCWSTDDGWDTALVLAVLAMDGWCVVSERMLIIMLSVEAWDQLCVELALGPLVLLLVNILSLIFLCLTMCHYAVAF